MEDDEDDFFAHQTAKSLNNKRIQLKQFYQTPVAAKQLSSPSNSESDEENDSIPFKKSKATTKLTTTTIKPSVHSVKVPQAEPEKTKESIRNEIDAIVTSCFKTNKEVKRKIKLGKRTAADDQEYEDEDEYLTHITHHHHHGKLSRSVINAMNKSQLEEDDEKVTRETAAYNRLDAVLRVTKPLAEKQFLSTDNENEDEDEDDDDDDEDEDDDELVETDKSHGSTSDKITLKIDHSDGRQLTLSLPSFTTLKSLYQQVAEDLCLSSIYLVYNNQTLKLDERNQFMTLKQLNFSSENVQLLESYPLIKKI
ncbi:hypothetical protein I4U23_021606 [Adineta vaga]|nr:hypothetical protein I4U23_021606 [Adineta vaga]